ncbi:RNA-directed DNA polymerase [Francisella opportunistica]|uniref:Reverse transcriptase n=1 Tax=Francisella opportunistica TaxID=2016517 RepID=A0A345JR91_9GAMM|nr:RNA-directed DNA polymerase [Francisella opportunistica]AXH29837.1 reverse transcriptase [Francisella opportunistica]AXH33132.1 reverse transcriptase [Francisella opportunistica]
MSKTVFDLDSKELKNFMLKHESYVNVDLPPYITFSEILEQSEKIFISKSGGTKSINDIYKKNKEGKKLSPKIFEYVNYKLFHNKDGNLDWRQFELINPILYTSLVLEISNEWDFIKKRLNKLSKISKIECLSYSAVSENKKKDKAVQIFNWWESIEQKSIELALEYQYLYHTDITNCYGSLYTHSIPWSLHSKRISKNPKRQKGLIGDKIDTHIQNMSLGQTNGIPQGSVLMDLIAEFVLTYIDACFTVQLKRIYGIKVFSKLKILRYRDDYRIFTNDKTLAENALKELSKLMIDFGFKLNATKTIVCENVILGAIKADKLEWLSKEKDAKTLQKKLLILHDFLQTNKNSGVSLKYLQEVWELLNKTTQKQLEHESITVLISIVIDIAYNNPRTYSVSMAVLSQLISYLDDNEKSAVIGKIISKFNRLPNTGYLDIWLQRACVKHFQETISFKENLCKLVDKEQISLWNFDWVDEKYIDELKKSPLVNYEILENIGKTISNEEFNIFSY